MTQRKGRANEISHKALPIGRNRQVDVINLSMMNVTLNLSLVTADSPDVGRIISSTDGPKYPSGPKHVRPVAATLTKLAAPVD